METMIRTVVEEASQVGAARRSVVALATRAGFGEDDAGRVATVVTELGTNLVKHATSGGEILARRSDDDTPTIEVISVDHGPGGDRPTDWLADGYSTAGSRGQGLGAVDRASDAFELVSAGGAGTVALARVRAGWRRTDPRPSVSADATARGPRPIAVGGVTVPIDGEQANGDSWSVCREGPRTTILVADGLGHGQEAAVASAAAVRTFEDDPAEDLVELLRRMDDRLRPTRGAAVGVARLDGATGVIRFAGVGNIAATVGTGERTQSLMTQNGTIGQGGNRPREVTLPLPPASLVVMHSDGAKGHWTIASYPGLVRRHPTLVSAILYRDHRRPRDDVTIVTARVP
jgi:anti-sigma regulatory factor (Ser/Thr protein kinase)